MYYLGYKLRKHIGNALKARSQAVRTALEKYNAAARALVPPRPALSWDNVVEYAFLADFDLLSDTREDVRQRPWARPASRSLMDQYFKIQRAHEEILRLNVEICRFVTHIHDEESFLLQKETELLNSQPSLARQLRARRVRLTLSNDQHIKRLRKLAELPGFTGSIIPGISVERPPTHELGQRLDSTMDMRDFSAVQQGGGDDDDECYVEDDAEDMAYRVLEVSSR